MMGNAAALGCAGLLLPGGGFLFFGVVHFLDLLIIVAPILVIAALWFEGCSAALVLAVAFFVLFIGGVCASSNGHGGPGETPLLASGITVVGTVLLLIWGWVFLRGPRTHSIETRSVGSGMPATADRYSATVTLDDRKVST